MRDFDLYNDAVVREAVNRSTAHICSVDEYLAVRRYTIGAMAVFAVYELDLNIPQEVMDHPTIGLLCKHATDMIVLRNVS